MRAMKIQCLAFALIAHCAGCGCRDVSSKTPDRIGAQFELTDQFLVVRNPSFPDFSLVRAAEPFWENRGDIVVGSISAGNRISISKIIICEHDLSSFDYTLAKIESGPMQGMLVATDGLFSHGTLIPESHIRPFYAGLEIRRQK